MHFSLSTIFFKLFEGENAFSLSLQISFNFSRCAATQRILAPRCASPHQSICSGCSNQRTCSQVFEPKNMFEVFWSEGVRKALISIHRRMNNIIGNQRIMIRSYTKYTKYTKYIKYTNIQIYKINNIV